MPDKTLRAAQLNIQRGGENPDGTRARWDLSLRLVHQLDQPELTFVNEARGWAADGRADEFAAALGATTWHEATNPNGYPAMIFVREPAVMVAGTWIDGAPWMRDAVRVGLGTVRVPGWPDITVAITHLSPWLDNDRDRQCSRLLSLTRRGPVIVGCDTNEVWPGDPEPDWSQATPDQVIAHMDRTASTVDSPLVSRRGMQMLADAGWIDCGWEAGAQNVPTSGFWPQPDTPMPMRKAHLLLNPVMDACAALSGYQVHDNGDWRRVSDHVPITANLIPRREPIGPEHAD